MAISWLLKDNVITSVLIGASSVSQLENNIRAIENLNFDLEELSQINSILE